MRFNLLARRGRQFLKLQVLSRSLHYPLIIPLPTLTQILCTREFYHTFYVLSSDFPSFNFTRLLLNSNLSPKELAVLKYITMTEEPNPSPSPIATQQNDGPIQPLILRTPAQPLRTSSCSPTPCQAESGMVAPSSDSCSMIMPLPSKKAFASGKGPKTFETVQYNPCACKVQGQCF